MPIQVIAGALAVAAAVPLLLFSLAATGQRWPGKRRNVLSDVTDVRQHVLGKSAWDRLGQPLTEGVGSALVRLSPQGWAERISRNIALAGWSRRLSVEQVILAKAGSAVLAFLFGWFGPISQMDLGWLVTLLITGVAFAMPNIWVRRRAEEHQHQIQIELPDVLDQITMSVDAGLGFEAAVARAAQVGEGPLADELSRTVQEMQLGVSRTDALRTLAERTEVPDLKSFVVTVVQSEEYGLPITKVLSVQADELRDKRRQRAEERALRIPVLLIFPLAFCIFPTIFIILLGPALIRIYRDIGLIAP